MTTYEGPRSKAGIHEILSVLRERDSLRVMLGEEPIGRIVSFGRSLPGGRERKTVYASRIYWSGLKIEVEGATSASVLNKVAAELARGLKDNPPEDSPPAPAF